MWRVAWAAVTIAAAAAVPGAAQRTTVPPTGKVSTAAACAADLGAGLKSHRHFCDIAIGARPADGVAMTIPRHTGGATLRFDLHNRFTTPAADTPPAVGFARQEAIVAIVRATGAVIDRVAASSEIRTMQDLFDRLPGTGPGGVKAIAPGRATPIVVAIPAGVSSLGIVGVRLTVLTRGGTEVFDSPGRPVAIVSNLRIEYQ